MFGFSSTYSYTQSTNSLNIFNIRLLLVNVSELSKTRVFFGYIVMVLCKICTAVFFLKVMKPFQFSIPVHCLIHSGNSKRLIES